MCVCIGGIEEKKGPTERERDSMPTNEGHEKCMDIVVSFFWSEFFSELCISCHPHTHSHIWPLTPFFSLICRKTIFTVTLIFPHAVGLDLPGNTPKLFPITTP